MVDQADKCEIRPLLLLIQVLFLILSLHHLIDWMVSDIGFWFQFKSTVLMQMKVSILFVVLLNSR